MGNWIGFSEIEGYWRPDMLLVVYESPNETTRSFSLLDFVSEAPHEAWQAWEMFGIEKLRISPLCERQGVSSV